jgi:UDP-2,4-diacetamido-2,4,6-trideoxy-beta-L-altropyranose hydrolase
MKVLFRTDASLEIGSGHVMRCLTLADALRLHGCESVFICREYSGHLGELIRQRGHTVWMLPQSLSLRALNADNRASHLARLGADWESDAEQTVSLVQDDFDLLVVDHYALDIRWESKLRLHCKKILVIDDLADREHDCDFLLDQNLVSELHSRYAGKVPVACVQMLGPTYSLLQPEYAKLHDKLPLREGLVRRVLIYFGGADTDNMTSMAISACLGLSCGLDIVVNPKSPYIDALRQQVRGREQIVMHESLPNLAALMAKADLAIGAGGATSWERCCLGLPTLVITLAENQKPIAAELDRRGLIQWLGHKNEVTESDLRKALVPLFKSGIDPAWSSHCLRFVDGLGVDRVCEILRLDSSADLIIRSATRHDEARFLEFTHAEVDTDSNHWFREVLRNIDTLRLFTVETKRGVPLGWVAFNRTGSFWELAVSFAKNVSSEIQTHALHQSFRKMRTSVGGLLFFRPGWTVAKPDSFSALDSCLRAGKEPLSLSICSDRSSWINDHIPEFILFALLEGHEVAWTHTDADNPGGELCFYLGYGRIVTSAARARYRINLVVHASDLPRGRGWSPASWLILEGARKIPVTLLEAVDEVDAGPIYLQEWMELDGTELIDDWRTQLANKTIDLARTFLEGYPQILELFREQTGEPSTYLRRRSEDSRLDPHKTISEQINLLRIVDNEVYPAFFEYENKKYVLKISKI